MKPHQHFWPLLSLWSVLKSSVWLTSAAGTPDSKGQGAWLCPKTAAAVVACVWIPAGARLCLTIPFILLNGDDNFLLTSFCRMHPSIHWNRQARRWVALNKMLLTWTSWNCWNLDTCNEVCPSFACGLGIQLLIPFCTMLSTKLLSKSWQKYTFLRYSYFLLSFCLLPPPAHFPRDLGEIELLHSWCTTCCLNSKGKVGWEDLLAWIHTAGLKDSSFLKD